jgi:hypothetical protein
MSKSANYCFAQLSRNTGLLLLAEVAARPHNELFDAKYDADVACKAQNALCVQIRHLTRLVWGGLICCSCLWSLQIDQRCRSRATGGLERLLRGAR